MALRVVLFLCTGNFYRSRFAECLFNHLAKQKGLAWRADSRGLALERLMDDGSISPFARAELVRRGIVAEHSECRHPMRVSDDDWKGADLVIALRGEEHRPLVHERHPKWSACVEYWEVGDIDVAIPAEALQQVAVGVDELVRRLAECEKLKSSKN